MKIRINESFIKSFLSNLGFLLIVDNCQRNCLHCQAYGNNLPISRMSFSELELTIKKLIMAMDREVIAVPPSIHCWRLGDPLDYISKSKNSNRTCVDVAQLWMKYFGYGLYIVTNGTEGQKFSCESLINLVKNPELLTEIKLTITPCDSQWGTDRYRQNILWDICQLAPLWEQPSKRKRGARLFRINAKCTEQEQINLGDFIIKLLKELGFSKGRCQEIINDPTCVSFKPIYDLGNISNIKTVSNAITLPLKGSSRFKSSANQRKRFYFGIRPSGEIFGVDMYCFKEVDVEYISNADKRVATHKSSSSKLTLDVLLNTQTPT